MSYSIIFETKIVKLSDGRIIHFDLSGCNNDNSGRDRHEFHAKIYTVEDFIKYAEHFKENSKPHKESDGFDLKIGSRYATMYDYGEHLLRMLKRAETYADFLTKRYSSAEYCIGIEFDSLGKELFVGYLATEVVCFNHFVAFKTIVAGITLHVHDCINTYSVCIGTGTCTNKHKFSSNILLNVLITLVHVHCVALNLWNIDV